MITKYKGKYRIYISQRNDGNAKNISGNFFFSGFFVPEQIHSSKIIDFGEEQKELEDKEVDGIITERVGTKIGVSLADCNGIALMGERYFAIIHAGWRGLYNGIIENLFEKMTEYGEDPSKMQVFVGPSIRQCCYQVSEDFLEKFSEKFFVKHDDGLFLDMGKIIESKCLSFGIPEENIESIDLCTRCNTDSFFSYRGGDGDKRFLVGIKKLV